MAAPFVQSAWSLNDLYSGHESADMQAAFTDLDQKVKAFESRRADLVEEISTDLFMEIVHQYEAISDVLQRIGAYAGLWFAAETQDAQAQTFVSKVDQLSADVGNRILFFSLWWKALSDEQAGRLLNASGDYRYWLEEMRHFKPHTLSEPEEKIVNLKNVTGSSALVTLYDAITNRYTFKLNVHDSEKEMTRGELMVFVRSYDPTLRAAAYRELYRVYGQDGPILGLVYQTRVRDWGNEQVDLRHFTTPMSARNLFNDIPDQVVDTLLDVAQRNTSIFQRYFGLKARLLGMDRLRRYDLYAPVAQSTKTYDFANAAEMVFDSFNTFDPQTAELARRVFEENHLDSEVRRGKRGGAFCANVTPQLTPWVLLNYQGRPEDVATMAHELGHAIHAMLANHHTLFTQHASLPLAETASTFGEMMLVDRLLSKETDEAVRRDLLFRQVDDSYATIQRQAYFALFERQAHELIQQGAAVDEISSAYMENLKSQFGDSMEVSDEFRWEWVSIPHIYHTPFYVYAYAFGQLLVLSLYEQYKAEGEAFKPRYLRILSSGGSASPAAILADAGIDIYSADFWQGGFNVIKGLVSQLEQMV